MDKSVELSVIVPVYNIQDQIINCLKSLHNQDLNNAEFLIINDGSTDKTEIKIKEYLKNIDDDRFKYYKRCNSGVSDTRNYGMKIAKGTYLSFIDGDDTLVNDKNIYNKLIKIMKQDNLEILEFNFQRIKNNISEGKGYYLSRTYGPISGVELMENLFNTSDKFHHEVVKFIFKNSFLKKINVKFSNIKIAEDQLWAWQVMLKAKRVKHIPNVYYNYITRNNSVMHINTRDMQLNKTKSVDKSIDQLLELIDDNHSELTEKQYLLFKNYLIKNYIVNAIQKCAFNINVNKQEFKKTTKINKNLDKKDKIKSFIVLYLPNKLRQKVCLYIFNKYIHKY